MTRTPSPLTIKGPSPGGTALDDGGDYAILDETRHIIGEAICRVGTATFVDAEANAKLWAASPELLEACRAICAWAKRLGQDTMRGFGCLLPDGANWRNGLGPLELALYDQAHAAIVKAVGEEDSGG